MVSRFTVSKDDPNRADPESELVVMEIEQPYQNHNGGAIEFGPDGYLYIGLGDGGDRNDPHGNGQNLSTLLGSILRIDVDHPASGKQYGIPADNPFVNVDGARPEIYAYGVRNPWRIAFDKETGNLVGRRCRPGVLGRSHRDHAREAIMAGAIAKAPTRLAIAADRRCQLSDRARLGV